MKKDQKIGYTASIAAGLSFGSITILAALLRDAGASSLESTFMRLFFGFIIALAVIFLFRMSTYYSQYKSSISFKVQKTYIIQGTIFAIMIIVYIGSIALYTPAGEAALLVQMHPFGTMFLGRIILKEKITLHKIVALLMALSGLIILITPWESDILNHLPGDLLAISNGFFYSIYLVTGRWSAAQRENISHGLSIAWVIFWGFICGLPLIIFLSMLPLDSILVNLSIVVMIRPEILFLTFLLTLLGSILPYGLIMISSKHVESSKASLLLLFEPVGAIILGAVLLNEPVTIWYIIGGSALIFAIAITILADKKE
ncbi:MAG: DMT family transporter [Candidatus Hodarchaeales archaeon]